MRHRSAQYNFEKAFMELLDGAVKDGMSVEDVVALLRKFCDEVDRQSGAHELEETK